jgi:hypothetical protein
MPAQKVTIDCAAFAGRLLFDDARRWDERADAARLAGDDAAVALAVRGAEACRTAGRNHLLQNGLPPDEAIDPETWSDLTPAELEQRVLDEAEAVVDAARSLRTQRNALLTQSDWTQLPDASLTAQAKGRWDAYRQELRDLPATTPDPVNPVYPTPPGGRGG